MPFVVRFSTKRRYRSASVSKFQTHATSPDTIPTPTEYLRRNQDKLSEHDRCLNKMEVIDKENVVVIDCEDDRKPAALPSTLQQKRANEEKSSGEETNQNEPAKSSVIEQKKESTSRPLTSKAVSLNKMEAVVAMDSGGDSGVDPHGARFSRGKNKELSNCVQREHNQMDNDAGNRDHKKARVMRMDEQDKSIRSDANQDNAAMVAGNDGEGRELVVPSQGHNLTSSHDSDLKFALRLQQQLYEEDGHPTQSSRGTPSQSGEQDSDLQLAMYLQQEEYGSPNQAESKSASNDMDNSYLGNAIRVVEKILELVENAKKKYPQHAINFNAVSSDDMVFLAKNLLEMQATFLGEGINAYVDIGYHYTNSKNLRSIRENGLMTKSERDSQGVVSDRFNGSSYGDGVYTANDSMTFSNYGDTGLLVGRLLGVVKSYAVRTGDENTVLVPERGMIVLRTSVQCLPMIKYDRPLVTTLGEGNLIISELHKSLQEILDNFFNPGLTAQAAGSTRATGVLRNAAMPILKPPGLQYFAPQSLSVDIHNDYLFCRPPSPYNFESDCPICHDPLESSQHCIALKVCKHVFHKGCIQQQCKYNLKCPTCRINIGEPIGKSPSGSMTIKVRTFARCGGYPNCNTIEIVYSMPPGTQKDYHENPGQRHQGKHAIAYLPDNADGRNLLKRLKFAFMHGLTFTVGTSMTTGATNQCTWSSIHHKTYPNGGVHGFPDPNYFANCNGELDSVNVPAADELDSNGFKIPQATMVAKAQE